VVPLRLGENEVLERVGRGGERLEEQHAHAFDSDSANWCEGERSRLWVSGSGSRV
jgi:hypothetical protein